MPETSFIAETGQLYELQGVSEELAREAFALAAAKMPIATQFVKRTVM